MDRSDHQYLGSCRLSLRRVVLVGDVTLDLGAALNR
jgi:hypothetical protein